MLVLFLPFFELWTVFQAVLGTIVKNPKHKTVAPNICLHFSNYSKNPSVTLWVLEMCFPKSYIFWAPNQSAEPVCTVGNEALIGSDFSK